MEREPLQGESAKLAKSTKGARRSALASNLQMAAPAVVLLPALVLGVAGITGHGPRLFRSRRLVSALTAGGAALLLARWQLARFFTEQPDYEVERRVGDLEIRRYPTRVVAETVVDAADWNDALDEGFHRLAGYIFGGNRRQERIAMTAPVTARSAGASDHPDRGERIAMTAPVTASRKDGRFVVSFTMPKERTLESLPAPRDERVAVRSDPGNRLAVIAYRASYHGDTIEAKQSELLTKVRAAGLTADGAPAFAGYDAPSTLPWLRRVEVWVPIR